jgi:hypothetical protein
VVGHEVADADRADPPVGEQRLKRLVGADGEVELPRQRLVEDQQVDLVDAELAGALVEGVQRLVVAVVADPDLDGRDSLLRRRLEDAEPERRDLDAVLQPQLGNVRARRSHGRTSTFSAVRSSIAV